MPYKVNYNLPVSRKVLEDYIALNYPRIERVLEHYSTNGTMGLRFWKFQEILELMVNTQFGDISILISHQDVTFSDCVQWIKYLTRENQKEMIFQPFEYRKKMIVIAVNKTIILKSNSYK